MNVYTLKIKSNVDCNIYIDDMFKANAEKNQIVMLPLEEGQYWVKAQNKNNPADVIIEIVSINQHRILEFKFVENTINTEVSDVKLGLKVSLNGSRAVHSKQVSPEKSALINEVVELLYANAKNAKMKGYKTIKDAGSYGSKSSSCDVPNIIWRILLSIGLIAIVIALIPTIIGAPVSIMIAKPGFDSIWKGDCDIF